MIKFLITERAFEEGEQELEGVSGMAHHRSPETCSCMWWSMASDEGRHGSPPGQLATVCYLL